MKTFKLCLIVLAFALFIAACNQAASTPNTANTAPNRNIQAETTPVPPSVPDNEVAAAKELYATNCMTCHRDTGKGGKVTVDGKSLDPIDLTLDKVKSRTDDKLFKQVSEGSPDDGMPAFHGKMSDDEIKSVVKYMRILQGK